MQTVGAVKQRKFFSLECLVHWSP